MQSSKAQPHHRITMQGSVDQITWQKCSQEDVLNFSRDKETGQRAGVGRRKAFKKRKYNPWNDTIHYRTIGWPSPYGQRWWYKSRCQLNGEDKPDSSDATCIFCDRKFSEGTRRVVWVECVMYQMWAHLEYVGAERVTMFAISLNNFFSCNK